MKHRKPRVSTIVFYSLLAVLVAVFFVVMSGAMDRLEQYLTEYQARHINTQYIQVFEKLFSDPDWGALYEEAGLSGTDYEGKDAFVAYMEEKVGDKALTCFIESNGTSGKKCPVYLDDQEIAVFYMVSADTAEPGAPSGGLLASLANALKRQSWKYDHVELREPRREQQVTVTTGYGRTVFVNGQPLDESHIVQTLTSQVENYLPEGLMGKRRITYRVDGLLMPPTVLVADQTGNAVACDHDPESGAYAEIFPEEPPIPEERETFIVEAAKAYCRYLIRADGSYRFTKYFQSGTDTFSYITHCETWMQDYKSYNFAEPQLSEYHCYGGKVYTVRLKLTLNVVRLGGTVKEYPIDSTFVVEPNSDGDWKITNMVNNSIQQETVKVRLDFMNGEESLGSMMVDAQANQLAIPAFSPPEGKIFAGWFRESKNEAGETVLSLVFLPEADGTIYLPKDTVLEPMVLYARYE